MEKKNIPVVDLDMGENESQAVLGVVKSRVLVEGKNASEFEKKFSEFVGAKHAIISANGTMALHLAMTAMGIGPKDEVITTPFTFVASSNSILFNGGIPIFVDIDRETYNIDPDLIEKAITPRTKAIMPVHIFGNPCDMPRIREIADKHDLMIIEDCAQAHDSRIAGKHAGNFGDLGCFSFYGTKNLIGGEGGAVITNDDDIATNLRSLKNHGRNPQGGYDHFQVGYNYRATDMAAAIMNVQMDRVASIMERRHHNGRLYRELLGGQDIIKPQKILDKHQSSDYIFAPIVINGKNTPEDLINWLNKENISSRTIYSKVNYQQPAYLKIKDWIMSRVVDYPDYSKVHCPNAEFIAKSHFELPMVTSLTDENIESIVAHLLNFFRK